MTVDAMTAAKLRQGSGAGFGASAAAAAAASPTAGTAMVEAAGNLTRLGGGVPCGLAPLPHSQPPRPDLISYSGFFLEKKNRPPHRSWHLHRLWPTT